MAVRDPTEQPIEIHLALRLSNVGYVFAFLIAAAFAPVGYFVFNSPEFTTLSLAFGVAYLCCYFVATMGLGTSARMAFSTIGALHYVSVLVCIGPYAGLQSFIAALLGAPLLIFARSETRLASIALVIIVTGIVAGEFAAHAYGPLIRLDDEQRNIAYLSNIASSSAFVAFLLFTYSRSSIANYLKLLKERQKSEEMLYELVPRVIADQMMRGETITAQSQGECSVLFADLVGFTNLSNELSPVHLVEVLNGVFSEIDQVCEARGIEKIKTIGDCYMAATGVFVGQNRPAELALIGLTTVEIVQSWGVRIGHPLAVRVGISTGQVISGVIGKKRPLFDVWGQTVNNAKLMEANCTRNGVLVSESTYWRLKGSFEFEPLRPIMTKLGQSINAYLLIGPSDSRVDRSDVQ